MLEYKLVRFTHPPEAEHNGMLELWNGGFKENRTQNADYALIFLF
jgi:hypothetical protein